MTIDAPLWVRLVLAALATWRLAVALYDGEFFGPLRYRMGAYLPEGERGWLGAQLGCMWCCTWIASIPAGLLALGPQPLWWFLLPFALSGAAMLCSGGQRIMWHRITQDDG